MHWIFLDLLNKCTQLIIFTLRKTEKNFSPEGVKGYSEVLNMPLKNGWTIVKRKEL